MKDQVLSIEKMQKLKELGIDISKASMVLIYYDENGNEAGWDVEDHGVDSPLFETYDSEYECWNSVRPEYMDAETGNYDNSYREDCGVFTLQDVIELMPCEFWATDGNPYKLEINNKHIGYVNSMHDYKEPLYYNWNDNLLENTYNMLVWLAENKYI